MNPYAKALEVIETPISVSPRMVFQIMQRVNDLDKEGVSYVDDWFDNPGLLYCVDLAVLYPQHELSRETALAVLREYSLAFELCSPTPTSNMVLGRHSVTWVTDGVAHERLV